MVTVMHWPKSIILMLKVTLMAKLWVTRIMGVHLDCGSALGSWILVHCYKHVVFSLTTSAHVTVIVQLSGRPAIRFWTLCCEHCCALTVSYSNCAETHLDGEAEALLYSPVCHCCYLWVDCRWKHGHHMTYALIGMSHKTQPPVRVTSEASLWIPISCTSF